MNILEYIPTGRENAISRRELRKRTRLTDRENRRLIQRARRDTPIITRDNGGGYYQPTEAEREDVIVWLQRHKARGRSVMAAGRGAKRWLDRVQFVGRIEGS